MRRSFYISLFVFLLAAGIVVRINQVEDKPASSDTSTPQTPSEFLDISEWGIKVPLTAFGSRPAKDYIIGRFPDSPSEAILFLDRTKKDVEDELGSLNYEILVRCLTYTQSISRTPITNNQDEISTGQSSYERIVGSNIYQTIDPQALCPAITEPYDEERASTYTVGLNTSNDPNRASEIIKSITDR